MGFNVIDSHLSSRIPFQMVFSIYFFLPIFFCPLKIQKSGIFFVTKCDFDIFLLLQFFCVYALSERRMEAKAEECIILYARAARRNDSFCSRV